MRRPWLALGCSVALAAAAAGHAEQAAELRVLAAASLTEAVGSLAQRFEGARVVPSFGASSELARQIKDGAPADVFLSASPEWIDFLAEAQKIEGAAVVFARNTLVCIASPGARAAHGAKDARTLLDRLADGDRVAIADASVPAGDYARKALERAGLLAAYTPRFVGQKDVRAVLHAVEQGELPVGFVYATDTKVAKVDVLFAFDPASHPPIEYHAAALRGAPHPAEARRFVAELRSAPARSVLTRAGFALP